MTIQQQISILMGSQLRYDDLELELKLKRYKKRLLNCTDDNILDCTKQEIKRLERIIQRNKRDE